MFFNYNIINVGVKEGIYHLCKDSPIVSIKTDLIFIFQQKYDIESEILDWASEVGFQVWKFIKESIFGIHEC